MLSLGKVKDRVFRDYVRGSHDPYFGLYFLGGRGYLEDLLEEELSV